MQIFLLWRNDPERPHPAGDMERRLREIYEPLLAEKPSARHLKTPAAEGVYLDLPVDEWRPSYYESDADGWALSLDYPVDAEMRLASRGIPTRPESVLRPLAAQLQLDAAPLLRELAPPFVLVWSSGPGDKDALYVQNDGLGFSQFFIYDDGTHWAATNRLFAFRALGLPVVPDAAEWAVRCSLGWFPLLQTGYRNISYLPPGTQLRIGPGGVERRQEDVLSDWVHGRGSPGEDPLEAGANAVIEHVQCVLPKITGASAGLTGGLDSRAIVATLIGAKADQVRLTVRGQPDSPDVLIAGRLAGIAGRPLTIRTRTAMPSDQPDALRASIRAALLWQAGYLEVLQAKTFLRYGQGGVGGGNANIMGQHGEIGRGYYAKRIGAEDLTDDRLEDSVMAFALQYSRSFLKDEWRKHVEEVARTAYRQANGWGLEGLDRLDFFYLYERTRRWSSGGQYVQPGKVIAPFLTPGFIRATYALEPHLRPSALFHRRLVELHLPAWGEVPYAYELTREQKKELRRLRDRKIPRWERKRRKWARRLRALAGLGQPRAPYLKNGDRSSGGNFNGAVYWKTVGRSLIDEALRTEGFWAEIYDPKQARARWLEGPDDLAILYLLEGL
jgi:hypothetical protein